MLPVSGPDIRIIGRVSIVSTERSADLNVSSRLPYMVPCVLIPCSAVTGESLFGKQLLRLFLKRFLDVCMDLNGVKLAPNTFFLTAT